MHLRKSTKPYNCGIIGPISLARHASDIAPSVEDLRDHSKSQGVFFHRLTFAVRYSHFHQLRLRHDVQDAASDLISLLHDDVAPKSWWAVLLCDSVEFLQYSNYSSSEISTSTNDTIGATLLISSQGAMVLLDKLNEIFTRTSHGCGNDYLGVLTRTIHGGGEKEALDRLKTVRLALAHYLARWAVSNVERNTVVPK